MENRGMWMEITTTKNDPDFANAPNSDENSRLATVVQLDLLPIISASDIQGSNLGNLL
jgi:hypothetical protein